MEISDKIKDEEVISFPRRINTTETRELMKYLAEESLLEIMYHLDEGSALIPKKGIVKEYHGLINKFSGHAYKNTSNTFVYFDGEIETSHLKSLRLSNEDVFNFENKNTRKLFGDLKHYIDNYFAEHPSI